MTGSTARLLPRLLAPAFGALLLGAAAVQGRFDEVEIELVEVADGVHCLYGAGGNLLVLHDADGVLLVDSQFAELAPRIRAAVADVADGPLRFLVNTHWHGDHTGGNGALADEAVIVAHENARRRLAGDPDVPGRRAEVPVPGTPRTLPVVTFGEGGLRLHVGGESVELVPVGPAHTDGDALVWLPDSRVLHTGDVYSEGRYPYVDLASGGSVAGLLVAVEELLLWLPEDAVVVPGHGAVGGRADLVRYRDMLRGSIAAVEGALAEGLDAPAMLAAGILEPWEPRWGGGSFVDGERYLEILTADLGR